MIINFYNESGIVLRDEWNVTDLTETVPQKGDQVIMDNGDILTVTGRTFGFIEGSDGKTQAVYLTLAPE